MAILCLTCSNGNNNDGKEVFGYFLILWIVLCSIGIYGGGIYFLLLLENRLPLAMFAIFGLASLIVSGLLQIIVSLNFLLDMA